MIFDNSNEISPARKRYKEAENGFNATANSDRYYDNTTLIESYRHNKEYKEIGKQFASLRNEYKPSQSETTDGTNPDAAAHK